MAADAADIQGTVLVTRKLTKRKVTAPASAYQRGVAVELGAEPAEDALAFEQSRVVVYLEGQLPAEPLRGTLEQKDRRFAPDTLVVPVGSTVSFPNLDPIFHNVFSLSGPRSFDLGNYPKDQTRTVTFNKPGVVFVYCHLHPNMAASIVVTPNSWATKAEPSGRFVLPGVPPGAYTVVAWHKSAGFFRKSAEVGSTRGAAIEFVIPVSATSSASPVARR